ncbi:hypothetical protein LSM04_005160 [Trypanosoma melophagium]|uniref:uncharacterized protein n=1 Tax=Trypanosoma melophagium TaxID=715481 RepID=UPI003519F213|nr:hypothetical protein LSM04_005160 [Trypanosoma melophagium]
MFQETIETVLEFIGSHSEQYGCSGVELLSFVSNDVLPHYGLAGHNTLQRTVLDLLISEGGSFTVKCKGKVVTTTELMAAPVPYNDCTFFPTLELQEKTLGISLRHKNVRAAVNYACDHFVTGFRRYRNVRGKGDGCTSVSGLGIGIRQLLREQWLRVLYVCENGAAPMVPYLVPHFAAPPTYEQVKKRRSPMETYLARRRGEHRPPFLPIDLCVARRIIVSSPEQKLVFEDAIHAIFAAHGQEVPKRDGRKMRFALQRMLTAAGLSVVRGSIVVRHRERSVWVVVPNSGPVASDDSDGNSDDENDENASDDNNDNNDDNNNNGSESSSGEENDEDTNDDDDENEIELLRNATVPKVSLAKMGNTSTTRKNSDIFCVDPSYPLPLQVVKVAEHQPVALESVLPRVILYDFRGTTQDVHRITRQYEERWGTIESSNVLSRHSKAFTRLIRPKGYDETQQKHINNTNTITSSSDHNDSVVDSLLPKGVSQWAVNKVMEALRSAPLQALSLFELMRSVDRRTLRRVLPYLRDEGRLTTTGITLANGRRVGIVVLAGIELNADKRLKIEQAYLDSLSARREKRQQSTVMLQHLPEPTEGGVGRSAAAVAIAKSTAKSTRLVTKLTMVRNGYCRVGLFRLSRLHIELWRIWCALGRAPGDSLTLEEVLQEMSLSSFCIIVGLADIDVGKYVNAQSLSSASGTLWGTPLRRLPPTLQQHCRHSGIQPLLHSLDGLQTQGLVFSDTSLAAYLDLQLSDVSIALAPTACDRQNRMHTFYSSGDPNNNNNVDSDSDSGSVCIPTTPQETCYALLNFWGDWWVTVTPPRESTRRAALIREISLTEQNLSNVQLVALSRLLRMDCGVLAEYLVQRQGMVQVRKRTLRDVLQGEETDLLQHGGNNNRTMPRRRIEVNGATMAEALDAAMHTEQPEKGFSRLLTLVRRYGKPLQLSSYNPYNSCVHGSLKTLMQCIVDATEKSLSSPSSATPTVLQSSVASVVSPNLSALPCRTKVKVKSTVETSPFPSTTTTTTTTTVGTSTEPIAASVEASPNEESGQPVEPDETLQDIIRMILLTDEAHYDAVAANALLSHFPEEDQQRCIEWLLRFPSFRTRSGGPGRLPRIELSPILSFVPAAVAACVTHRGSASATFVHDMATGLLFTPHSNCQRWCMPPFTTSEEDDGREVEWMRRAPRLVEQPSLDLSSLAEGIREQKGLAVVRLPRFVWPSPAASTTKPTLTATTTNTTTTTNSSSSCTTNTTNTTNTGHTNTVPKALPTAASMRQALEPYPARGLLRTWSRLQHLELRDIPIDPPPSLEQVSVARAGVIPSDKKRPALRYPSIFHHVDGAFHEFLWRSFLFAVYTLVHQSPGITESQLMQRLKGGGLVSSDSCKIALEFLKQSLVIVTRCTALPCEGESPSPFATTTTRMGEATCQEQECYYCTVPQEGPWNVMNL